MISGLGTVMVVQSSHHQGRTGSVDPLKKDTSALQQLCAKSCPANGPSKLNFTPLPTLTLSTKLDHSPTHVLPSSVTTYSVCAHFVLYHYQVDFVEKLKAISSQLHQKVNALQSFFEPLFML